MYAGDNVSAEDIEACAQGYLAGWASALRGAKPAAFAAWLRARGDAVVNDDPAAAETLYLAAEQVPAGLSAPAWAALGEATDERDAAQLAMVEALESHTAQLRGARATIAELLRADEGAKAAREERWSKYLADVERLTAEHDAAFARGVEAMRDAAATYFARRSEGIEHAAAKLSCIAPTAGARIPRMSAPLTLAAIGEPERGNASDTLTRRDDAIHVSIAWRWPTNKHLAEWTVDLHAAASRIDAPDADVWTFVTRDADEAIAVFNDPEAHRLRFSLGAR